MKRSDAVISLKEKMDNSLGDYFTESEVSDILYFIENGLQMMPPSFLKIDAGGEYSNIDIVNKSMVISPICALVNEWEQE